MQPDHSLKPSPLMRVLKLLQRHKGAVGTLVVVLGYAYVVYGSRFGDADAERLMRAGRECGWAVQTNLMVQSRCDDLVARFETHTGEISPTSAGQLWMYVAQYRLVTQDIPAARRACAAAMRSYDIAEDTLGWEAIMREARGICESVERLKN